MIQEIQNWMERVYRLSPSPPAGNFFIEHHELMQLLGKDHPLADSEEVVLLVQKDQEVLLGLYLKENLQATLQTTPELTYHQLCTWIEGVSHLLLLMDRLRSRQQVTLLELELQAEVDKFLFLRLSLSEECRRHSHDHLKKAANLKTLDKERKNTYESALRLANRYCRRLEKSYLGSRSVGPLWEELRQFYRMTHWKKLTALGLP